MPPTQTTLVFLQKDDNVLLGLKKRDFGVGYWNGVGGKLQAGESAVEAAVRETTEELNIIIMPQDLIHAGELEFHYPGRSEDDLMRHVLAHVFITREWRDNPLESDEVKPEWFKIDVSSLTPPQKLKHIKDLRKQMRNLAFGLDFEEAIKIRDKIRELEKK